MCTSHIIMNTNPLIIKIYYLLWKGTEIVQLLFKLFYNSQINMPTNIIPICMIKKSIFKLTTKSSEINLYYAITKLYSTNIYLGLLTPHKYSTYKNMLTTNIKKVYIENQNILKFFFFYMNQNHYN